MQRLEKRIDAWLFALALALVVYMPLHVFITQSVSLVTGGLDVWKAAKDVVLFSLLPLLLWIAYTRGLFQDKLFRKLFILVAVYGLLHGLFLLFDKNDDTRSTIVASVFNTRLFIYLLLGWLVATANVKVYMKRLLTAAVLIAAVVSLFGIAQYFLPHDLLTHVGYTLDRGVKPLFFIDDKPDLPRIMSTLKDPNSLGAYLIVPILMTGYALRSKKANKTLFVQPFRQGTLAAMTGVMILAVLLTFSRGAAIALTISIVTILSIVMGERVIPSLRKYAVLFAGIIIMFGVFGYMARDTYVVQNVIFHADESTVLEDPNELRVSFTRQAIDSIIDSPRGHGPGTAGLVAISNPKGGVLTENYYLQIAYEVGWLGLVLLVAILSVVTITLYRLSRERKGDVLAQILIASLVGYLFYSLLIHLWSNEAISFQWWLLAGLLFGNMKQFAKSL